MKNMTLPECIYSHLDRFGNTIISDKLMKSLGEEKIISLLKEKGYAVDIIAKEDFIDGYQEFNYSNDPQRTKKSTKNKKNMTFILQLQ